MHGDAWQTVTGVSWKYLKESSKTLSFVRTKVLL